MLLFIKKATYAEKLAQHTSLSHKCRFFRKETGPITINSISKEESRPQSSMTKRIDYPFVFAGLD
ncbi:hypothetical protein EX87_09640 [Brevibacillus laterosporus]|uniref:Uncharacterized protein n=1 Tax=Brevibacillus laterosporus TaxID=1465 RepID=A0A0F6XZJ2_BRELA|nr:hypothetical protein EX87_09640 [Brevibacillus laterosporus]